jgi:hypothetical protein
LNSSLYTTNGQILLVAFTLDVPTPSLASKTSANEASRGELLLKRILEGLTVLGELLDTLVQLVECHLLLKERPPELGLVVNKRNLLDGCGRG